MKHLMPSVVRVQRALGAPLQDSLISLHAAPTATSLSADERQPPANPQAGSRAAPLSPTSLTAAFAARLQTHQCQQASPSAESSALRDLNLGQPASSSPTTPGCIPLAAISPLRSCAPTVPRCSSLKTPAPRASPPTGLGFPCVKTPHASVSQKKLHFEATPRYGLQGPRVLQQLDGTCSTPAAGGTPESALQRKLIRQSEGGLLPISLNILQV